MITSNQYDLLRIEDEESSSDEEKKPKKMKKHQKSDGNPNTSEVFYAFKCML